jgi:hypothetical protein
MDRKLLRQLDVALRKGARGNGFNTDLWTLPRVAIVIERVTGVHYHPGHVWKLLGAMDWTLQRPAKQARERSPEAVKYWVEERWPEVKKRSSPESVDLLPRREWCLAAAVDPTNLGSKGRNSCPDSRVQLGYTLSMCGDWLSLGRAPFSSVLPDASRKLQL